VSVFTVAKARQVDEAARRIGLVQPLLLWIHSRDDLFFGGMEGVSSSTSYRRRSPPSAALSTRDP
jgi:predicted amino acid racemase